MFFHFSYDNFISFGSWGTTEGYGGGELHSYFSVPGVIYENGNVKMNKLLIKN